ncbi:MAG: hypothetical protein H7Y42_15080 [Chitinophagaceae bacterium]|nr:hypothetical protein [Chitinophagaceae bacterium]
MRRKLFRTSHVDEFVKQYLCHYLPVRKTGSGECGYLENMKEIIAILISTRGYRGILEIYSLMTASYPSLHSPATFENGFAPSIREIILVTAITSASAVNYNDGSSNFGIWVIKNESENK